MIKDCTSEEDFRKLVEASKERPVFLLKHSSVCPMSKGALRQFTEFSEAEPRPEYWLVLVRENKNLAQEIARETEIPHESPQVILFVDGKAIWKASSRGINPDNMARQIKRAG
jgi:bacillithiol system protein YtxJ